MYRGFNITLDLEGEEHFQHWKSIGQKQYAENKQLTQFSLNSFINNDNSLDGAAIQSSWFPQIEADIFISHSHKNLDTAIALAGWLYENFELTSFIDSCIWGYSENLQRAIDNKHCFIPSRNVYSYELRNHSTSHVHMMLSTALAMMIDKAECLFFLNTPNSIKAYGTEDRTLSPWIYSEIATSQIIEKKEPHRLLTETFSNFDGEDEIKKGMDMTHTLDLSHLTKLTATDFNNWQSKKIRREHALDTLYRLHPPKKKGKQLLK